MKIVSVVVCCVALLGSGSELPEDSIVPEDDPTVIYPNSHELHMGVNEDFVTVRSPLRAREYVPQGTTLLEYDEVTFSKIKQIISSGQSRLRLKGMKGEEHGEELDVLAFSVSSSKAKLFVGDEAQAFPRVFNCRGHIKGQPNSHVLLTFGEKGSFGVIRPKGGSGEEILQASSESGSTELTQSDTTPVPKKLLPSVQDDPAPERTEEEILAQQVRRESHEMVFVENQEVEEGYSRALKIGIECDEYCNFSLKKKGINIPTYLNSLVAATSAIMMKELGYGLVTTYMKIWNVPKGSYTYWRSGESNSWNAMQRFGSGWKASLRKGTYDLAHLFTNGRGLALMGAACYPSGYGLTGLDEYGRHYQGHIVKHHYNWDLLIFAHEVGHNIGSKHSWDYNPPMDWCPKSGCHKGTIMSYCQQCPGGNSVVDLTFGVGGPAVKAMKQYLGKYCHRTVQKTCACSEPCTKSGWCYVKSACLGAKYEYSSGKLWASCKTCSCTSGGCGGNPSWCYVTGTCIGSTQSVMNKQKLWSNVPCKKCTCHSGSCNRDGWCWVNEPCGDAKASTKHANWWYSHDACKNRQCRCTSGCHIGGWCYVSGPCRGSVFSSSSKKYYAYPSSCSRCNGDPCLKRKWGSGYTCSNSKKWSNQATYKYCCTSASYDYCLIKAWGRGYTCANSKKWASSSTYKKCCPCSG